MDVEFADRPAPLPAFVVGLPLSALGLSLLVFGISSGAEPWIVLGLFSSGVGFGCLFQRGCAIAGFGCLILAIASLLIYTQIIPQYKTYTLLESIDPKAQVALYGRRLEPDMEKRVLKALSESHWDPGKGAKARKDNWERAPLLSITSNSIPFDVEVGIMNETPVLRRDPNEGMNSGIITCPGLREPLAELGWQTRKGRYNSTEWHRPKPVPATEPEPPVR